MIRLPELNKKNWKKILREIDESKFPSLPDSLKALRKKMKAKEPLLFSEEQLGYGRLFNYFQAYQKEINALYIQTIDYTKFSNRPPLPHQPPAIQFLLENNRCILGDDMGLSKSSSSIYAALSMESKMKILVVTMKSLKYNFAHEIRYFNEEIAIIDKKWKPDKFTIVNYDSVKKWKDDIIAEKYDIIILDEAHLIKNSKTQRFKAIDEVLKDTQPLKVWLLTGTPISNRPIDFYPLLKILKHPVSKNWVKFVERYCEGGKDAWGRWQTKGASNLEELHNVTKDLLLRRIKKPNENGMPNKTRTPIFFELKNRKGYDEIIDQYETRKIAELEENEETKNFAKGFETAEMTRLLLYRQFCALEKVEDGTLTTMIDDILDKDPENKIIVFTNFTKVVDAIGEKYPESSLKLDGRILDPKKRQGIVDEFNANPNLRVLAANLMVGGTGYNIQSANIIVVNDMFWVPSTMLQAEDRAWRIGQKRDVEIYYPVYDDTAEVVIYNTIESKMKIVTTVVEGKSENYFEETGEKVEFKESEKDAIMKAIFAQMGF